MASPATASILPSCRTRAPLASKYALRYNDNPVVAALAVVNISIISPYVIMDIVKTMLALSSRKWPGGLRFSETGEIKCHRLTIFA